MTDHVDRIRGPQAEWINSKCPACGGYYFGAALEYAQRLHDKDGACSGRLAPIEDPQRSHTTMSMSAVQSTTRCAECGGPFTDAEWDARHSDEDGEDVHDRCCRQCIDQLAASGDDEAQPVIIWPGFQPPRAKAAPKRRTARRKGDLLP